MEGLIEIDMEDDGRIEVLSVHEAKEQRQHPTVDRMLLECFIGPPVDRIKNARWLYGIKVYQGVGREQYKAQVYLCIGKPEIVMLPPFTLTERAEREIAVYLRGYQAGRDSMIFEAAEIQAAMMNGYRR